MSVFCLAEEERKARPIHLEFSRSAAIWYRVDGESRDTPQQINHIELIVLKGMGGYVLSSSLFIIYMDMVMKEVQIGISEEEREWRLLHLLNGYVVVRSNQKRI